MAINASTGEVFSGYGRPSEFEHKNMYGVKSVAEAAREVNVMREVDVCVVGGGPGGIAGAGQRPCSSSGTAIWAA